MDARGSAQAILARAMLASRQGRHDEAVRLLEAVLSASPGDQAARYRLAEALVEAGRPAEAIAHLRSMIGADPKALQPLRLLGALCYQQGRFDDATRVFESLIALRPKSPEFVESLAKCRMSLGAPRAAIEVIESAVARGVDSEPLALTLARSCFRAGLLDRAESILRDGAGGASEAERMALLSQVLERSRRYDEALVAAEQAIASEPGNDVPHRVIARIDRSRRRLDHARARLSDLLSLTLSHEARAHVCMELGQVLDDLGEFPDAMAMFERGHESFAEHNPSLDRDVAAYIGRLRRSLVDDGPGLGAISPAPSPPDDGLASPIFLVGFPRSGTTLLEQIIGGLEGVVTSDEAPMLVETVNYRLKVGGAAIDPMIISTFMRGVDDEMARALRARYWTLAAEHVGARPGDGTLVDKHPMNTPLLGVVARLFPDARIVTAIRDPRDAVLSAYMQDMIPSRGMLHFRTLRVAADLYDAMMRLYSMDRSRLALRIHETRYEDLLSEPEATARALVEFLGAEWDDSVLRFAERAGSRRSGVNPYSTSKDLFRSSYGRWRRYSSAIARVEDLLAHHVQKFGYAE